LFLILPINWEGDKMRGQNEDTAAGEKFEPPSDPEHLFTWVRKQVTLHPSTERERSRCWLPAGRDQQLNSSCLPFWDRVHQERKGDIYTLINWFWGLRCPDSNVTISPLEHFLNERLSHDSGASFPQGNPD
jgi:hypothetical protein